jgi:hypothetical protein
MTVTATKTEPRKTARASNHRASVAALLGIGSVLALPVAIVLAQRSKGIGLVDAAWAIPFGAGLGFLALGVSNLARARVQLTVGRAGGEGRARTARILAVLGICLAVTAAISVGFYELLLHFEK